MVVPDIIRLTPNHYEGTPTGKLVVIHATRSGRFQNPTEFEGTLNYFQTSIANSSSHWIISRTGLKARVVNDDNLAWHAGPVLNHSAWGIELEQATTGEGFTPEQIAALVEVCKDYIQLFGVAPRHTLDISESGFIGHEETPQGRLIGKSDPGFLFPWKDFIAALQPAIIPTNDEMKDAALSAAHFMRVGWNVADLSLQDKTSLRHLVSLLGE